MARRLRWPLWLQITLLLLAAGTLPLAVNGLYGLRSLRASAGRVESALVATVNLTEMWSLVEELALDGGTTKVVDKDGRLIAASGDLDKEAVFELEKGPVVGALGAVANENAARVLSYTDGHAV